MQYEIYSFSRPAQMWAKRIYMIYIFMLNVISIKNVPKC